MMTIADKIKDEKLQYISIENHQKYQHYRRVKLINMNVLQVKKCYHLIKVE